jgi:chaperonin GroEL
MLKKNVKFGTDVSKNLLQGVKILHDAVVATMGVSGKNVMFNDESGLVKITKDGVTVAKNISHLEDAVQDFGARVVKHSAIRTSETAGDGTTTATLLSYHLIKEAMSLIDNGSNVVQVQKGIEKASKMVLNELFTMKKEITSDNSNEMLTKVATLSSNGDTEVAKMIVTGIETVGQTGIVTVSPSKYENVRMEEVTGTRWEKGWLSENFINNGQKISCELNNPIIVVSDKDISNAQSIAVILQHAYNADRSILFIAKSFSGGAMATLIKNASQGVIKLCAVEVPPFRENNLEFLQDICAVTGATLISAIMGKDMVDFTPEWLGEAESVSVTKSTTTIIDGKGNVEEITKRVNLIRQEIENTESTLGKNLLYSRLSNLIGTVCNILIGGKTKMESDERYDRAEDALKATYCALEEGILMGGGVALLKTKNRLNFKDETIFTNKHQLMGADVVKKILTKPFEQILRNAGYEFEEIYGLINLIKDDKNDWNVFDPLSDKIVDGYEFGIIDPYKVTRTALENAVSVCGTIITTDCVIEEKFEQQPNDMLAQLMQQTEQ